MKYATSRHSVPLELSARVIAHLEEIRPTMSVGQFALEVLDACMVEDLTPPRWALEVIQDCYYNFKTGAPPQGNLAEMLEQPAPRTLGEAFGVSDHKGEGSMRTRRMKRLLLPWLQHMFDGPLGLPRTRAGRLLAAEAHGITEQQVLDWLPKTRKNVRGHKPQRESLGAHLGVYLAGGKIRKKAPLKR
jgi:hypothetical protein